MPASNAALNNSASCLSFFICCPSRGRQNAAYRRSESGPIARLAQSAAQLELQARAGTSTIADVGGISAGERMSVDQVREPNLRKGPRNVPLQPFIQAAQQHVGSARRIAVHGNDGIAPGDQLERAGFVEAMAAQVQAVEIVAGGAQPLEKIERVLVAGDQPRNLRSPPLDLPAV